MLQSLIPGVSRVSLWVVFCFGLLSGPDVSSVLAQAPKAEDPAPSDEEDEIEKKGLVDTKKSDQGGLEERFLDPNAQDALANTFRELYPKAATSAAQLDRMEKAINAMASGGNADRVQIANYLQSQAAILTKHSNIEAILDPEMPSKTVKDVEDAAYRLKRPLEIANDKGNENFRKIYTESLITVSEELLKNQLFARVWAMEALSRCMDDAALPVFIKQLDDANQVLTVKLLSASGITNLTQGGTRDLSFQSASKAAQSLANFLERERNIFWPIQFRALEALGSLRISTLSSTQPKAEFAETALQFLADPKAAPASRAWAAWALGMMRPLNPKFNFELVAYHNGLAVADIGDEIVKAREKNPQRATWLTDLLVPLHQCFTGMGPGVRNSGLLNASNPNLGVQKSKVSAMEGLVRDVLAKAIELSLAAGSQVKGRQEALAASVAALREGLKTPPTDLALIPGGDPFPPVANPAAPTAPTTGGVVAPEAGATPPPNVNTSSLNRRAR